MRQVVSTIKRGQYLIGRVYLDSTNNQSPYQLEVTCNGTVYPGRTFFDEDEAIIALDDFMHEVAVENFPSAKPKI